MLFRVWMYSSCSGLKWRRDISASWEDDMLLEEVWASFKGFSSESWMFWESSGSDACYATLVERVSRVSESGAGVSSFSTNFLAEVWASAALTFGLATAAFFVSFFFPLAFLNSSSIWTDSSSPPVLAIAAFSIFYYISSAWRSPTKALVFSSVLSLSNSFWALFSSSTAFWSTT